MVAGFCLLGVDATLGERCDNTSTVIPRLYG